VTSCPDKPNYTQIPNSILGDIQPGNKADPGLLEKLEGSELKVLLVIYRLTFGFHQESRRASLKLIQEMTGLSKQGVFNAAKSLEEKHGLIERKQDGGVTLWKAVVNSVDHTICKDTVNSVDQPVNSVDRGGQLSRPPSKKETIKKPKKKEDGDSPSPTPKKKMPDVIPSFKVYVEETDYYALNKQQRHIIHQTVGTDPANLEQWREVVKAWILSGYNPVNAKGMIDWFENGIPEHKKGRRNGHKQMAQPAKAESSYIADAFDALS